MQIEAGVAVDGEVAQRLRAAVPALLARSRGRGRHAVGET
jgi:hypothetical protein